MHTRVSKFLKKFYETSLINMRNYVWKRVIIFILVSLNTKEFWKNTFEWVMSSKWVSEIAMQFCIEKWSNESTSLTGIHTSQSCKEHFLVKRHYYKPDYITTLEITQRTFSGLLQYFHYRKTSMKCKIYFSL